MKSVNNFSKERTRGVSRRRLRLRDRPQVNVAHEYDTAVCREGVKQNTASPSRWGCVLL